MDSSYVNGYMFWAGTFMGTFMDHKLKVTYKYEDNTFFTRGKYRMHVSPIHIIEFILCAINVFSGAINTLRKNLIRGENI